MNFEIKKKKLIIVEINILAYYIFFKIYFYLDIILIEIK